MVILLESYYFMCYFLKWYKFYSMYIIVKNYCIFVRVLNIKKKYYVIIYLYNYMIVYYYFLGYFLKISVM